MICILLVSKATGYIDGHTKAAHDAIDGPRNKPAGTVEDALSNDRRPQQNKHMRMYLTPCLAKLGDEAGRSFAIQSTSDTINSGSASPMRQSDKCAVHSYHYAYHRYLSPLAEEFHSGARAKVKVLEIGLGCGQINVGAGVRLWNEMFRNVQGRKLDLHVMEYDSECLRLWERKWAEKFPHVNLTSFSGDQSDENTLRDLLKRSGGEYDAIIEDGGHSMLQQQVSLRVLFPALKPGGFCKRGATACAVHAPTLALLWPSQVLCKLEPSLLGSSPPLTLACLSACLHTSPLLGKQTQSRISKRATSHLAIMAANMPRKVCGKQAARGPRRRL